MNVQDVLDPICKECGGIPWEEGLPFWTYDEYDECECPLWDEDDWREDCAN